MPALLTIGEFARATHLSVKALRHYDELGLLHPADVDTSSGYRRYAIAQVPIARVIRRFRELDMPLDDIRVVIQAPDVASRDAAIVGHLRRMEDTLEQTQATVASLRALLEGKETTLPVEFRTVPDLRVIARREHVSWDDTAGWLDEVFRELHRALLRGRGTRAGADGALFSPEFFEAHFGEIVAYVPLDGDIAVTGGVEVVNIPGAQLAVTLHRGPFSEIDQAYSALGSFVAERAIGADGPVREHYLVTPVHSDDPSAFRTEVAWPIKG